MKHLFVYALLTGLAGCGEAPVGELVVSSQANTWLEVRRNWTGGFSGSAHYEYQVLYVRRGFFTDDEQFVGRLPILNTPLLQQVDAQTIRVSVAGNGQQAYLMCTFTGPWPAVNGR